MKYFIKQRTHHMSDVSQFSTRHLTAMTRIVILLLLFEFIYVKTTRVVDNTNLIDTLDLLLEKVDKFELREDGKDFVDSEVDYDVDWEKAEFLKLLTSEQVAEFNKAIQESGKDADEATGDKVDDGEDDIWPDDVSFSFYSQISLQRCSRPVYLW